MDRFGCVLLLVTFFAVNQNVSAESVADESKKLQGRWSIVEVEVDGAMLPTDDEASQNLVFEGEKVTLSRVRVNGSVQKQEAIFKIDPTKRIKEIDLIALSGADKGVVLRGIYALDGDNLRLCINTSTTSNKNWRPSKFETKKGDGLLLQIAQRDDPDPRLRRCQQVLHELSRRTIHD